MSADAANHEAGMLPSSREELFSLAASRGRANPLRLSIRELLSYWRAKRRGELIIEEIRSDLARANLTTVPPFTDGWIDTRIMLVPTRIEAEAVGLSPAVAEEPEAVPSQVGLRVRSLESANAGVTSARLDDDLDRVQAIMMNNDYSQLAVLSGPRSLRGAISWESIAQAKIGNSNAGLREALFPPEVVRLDDDLLAQIPRIADAGFVIVEAPDRQVTGIVTTTDLTILFGTLAKPFFVLAEIERRLRRLIDKHFSTEDVAAVVDPADTGRKATRASDLTLGESVRLLEEPTRWRLLGWNLDRQIFIEALQAIRVIRNDVMHFSPDPLDDEQVKKTELFLKWLRKLDPEP